MKKLLLSILMVLVFATPSLATDNTFTVVSGANWSTAANWSGGHVPAADENVIISGNVTWDVATVPLIPATGRLGTITSSGTYTITVDLSDAACHTSGACKILFTTATALSDNLFTTTGAAQTPKHYVTIDGTTCTASAVTSAKSCIYHNSGNIILADVALVGSSGATGNGLKINAAGALVTTTKNITGGGTGGSYGLYGVGTSTSIVTVAGGVVTGGGTYGAPGIYNSTGSINTLVVSAGVKLVNSALGSAIYGSFIWDAGPSDYWNINGLYVSKAPTTDKVSVGTSVVNSATGDYEAGTASGGGGTWGF